MQRFFSSLAIAVGVSLPATFASAAEPLPEQRIDGDIGGAIYQARGQAKGANSTLVLPYAYFDYGRFLARVDTFGLRTIPMGNGFLEVVGRVSFEGFEGKPTGLRGINDRSNPLPIGLGSRQHTPIGDFFTYGFHDLVSSGSLVESTYVTELKLGQYTLYPQLGIEYRSARYVRHLYGVSSAESSSSGIASYSPGASVTPTLGLAIDIPTGSKWVVTAQWRRKWFDNAVTNSSLTDRKTQDIGYLSLAYRF
ncbi:MAG: MipA/OmpV family protein [Betaproteobacteria bacterium]